MKVKITFWCFFSVQYTQSEWKKDCVTVIRTLLCELISLIVVSENLLYTNNTIIPCDSDALVFHNTLIRRGIFHGFFLFILFLFFNFFNSKATFHLFSYLGVIIDQRVDIVCWWNVHAIFRFAYYTVQSPLIPIRELNLVLCTCLHSISSNWSRIWYSSGPQWVGFCSVRIYSKFCNWDTCY